MPEELSPDYAAERKAAEWVLSVNGKVAFEDASGKVIRKVSESSTTLPVEDFAISAIELINLGLDDQLLANLSSCTRIKSADIRGNRFTSIGLQNLSKCRRLNYLSVANNPIGAGFGKLLQNWPHIEAVFTASRSIDDAAMEGMPILPRLWVLSLEGSSLSDDGFASVLRCCPRLGVIDIQSTKFGWKGLKSAPTLWKVGCSGSRLTRESVQTLLELPSLATLYIVPDWTDGAIAELLPLKSRLKLLVLNSDKNFPGLSEDALLSVAQLTSLQEFLYLGPKGVCTDKALQSLAKLPDLRRLEIEGPANSEVTTEVVTEFRRQRPDVRFNWHPTQGARDFPALVAWPEGPDGGVAPWDLPTGAPPPAIIPFTPEQAKQYQEAWATYLKKPIEIENDLGMKFRLIPPGEFESHSENADSLYRISDPIYYGTTEVTYGQFAKFVEETHYKTEAEIYRNGQNATFELDSNANWKSAFETDPRRPVTHVQPADIQAFCEWLGKRDSANYRVAYVSEWEFATRAGGAGEQGYERNGEDWLQYEVLSSIDGKLKLPQFVGSKKANPFGLYDMIGNVHEYCLASGAGNHLYRFDVRGMSHGNTTEENGFPNIGKSWGAPHINKNVGFRVVRTEKQLPSPLTQPLLIRRGQPLSPHASVSRPAKITGLRSWSVEPKLLTDGPLSVAINQDNQVATSGYEVDGATRLWGRRGEVKELLLGSDTYKTRSAWSPDKKWLAVAGFNGSLDLWGGAKRQRIQAIPPTIKQFDGCSGIMWSPDSESIALCGEVSSHFRVFSLRTMQTRVIPGPEPFYFSWSNDGSMLAATHFYGGVDIYRTSDWQVIKSLPIKLPRDVKFGGSIDAPILAVSADDFTRVSLWNAKTWEPLPALERPTEYVEALAWSPDGTKLAGGYEELVVWNVESGKLLWSKGTSSRHGLAWTPEGKQVITASQSVPRYFDAESGTEIPGAPLTSLPLHSHKYRPFKSTPDLARILLQPDPDRAALQWWDARQGVLLREFTGFQRPFSISPDGKQVALTGGAEAKGSVLFFVPDKPEPQLNTLIVDPSSEITNIAWSPDGKLVAAAGQKTIKLWDVAAQKIRGEITASEVVKELIWTAEAKQLAFFGESKVEMLDVASLQRKIVYRAAGKEGIWRLLLCPGEDRFAVGESNDNVYLVDGANPESASLLPVARDWVVQNWTRDGSGVIWNHRSMPGVSQIYNVTPRTVSPNPAFPVAQSQYGSKAVWMEPHPRLTFADDAKKHATGVILPLVAKDHWLVLGPTGHYRGTSGVEDHIVYVAQTEEGEYLTLAPSEFQKRFGWQNDPAQAWHTEP
ncbi:SUMF1/EgtB/PvdO family nonheme iron enzyme [Anatilimnocola floriformis]|uniref:SUMF1/EgtB/PvdO family nonheme iron enzyme n=1 Tax=Anatilimnocola floriformis TaxID=2948575 RepID=UPI0020C2D7C3|nr:SUMF1/EgtB/PvdO family nonheme iron enzyme [Anatilimnocola floriformis]